MAVYKKGTGQKLCVDATNIQFAITWQTWKVTKIKELQSIFLTPNVRIHGREFEPRIVCSYRQGMRCVNEGTDNYYFKNA
jgi:hypothetical protein